MRSSQVHVGPSFADGRPIGRTSSSPNLPLSSPHSLGPNSEHSSNSIINMGPLTPPRSPLLDRVHSNSRNSRVQQDVNTQTPCKRFMEEGARSFGASDEEGEIEDLQTIECPFEFDLVKNPGGRPELFGQGVWSKVYRATGRSRLTGSIASSHGALTPPKSPAHHVPLVVAVKAPISKASRVILENEAYILSRLMRTPGQESFVVPFYGFIPTTHSVVLKAVPLSLSKHIAACNKVTSLRESSLTSTAPVVGSVPIWRNLTGLLVSALAWLHDFAGVVHGDIKPANILLCADHLAGPDSFPFRPLLIDFSSSHILTTSTSPMSYDTPSPSSPSPSPSTTPTSPSSPFVLSAVTREFTAPELLRPAVLRDPTSTPTPESDVFSLAVTLLVCATGDLAVYPGNVYQRQHMAVHGWEVLEFVRNGDAGSRVPVGGVVEQVLEKAVLKVGRGRIAARDWVELIERKGGWI